MFGNFSLIQIIHKVLPMSVSISKQIPIKEPRSIHNMTSGIEPPKVKSIPNPIHCYNKNIIPSMSLRGDFWVFYNYIPAKSKFSF